MASFRSSPQQVEGYADALSLGLLPVVGAHPPPVLPGRSARHLFNRWVVVLAVGLVAVIASGLALSKLAHPPGFAFPVLGAAAVLFLAGEWAYLGRVGTRAVAELQHGYATLTLTQGTFWMQSIRPFNNPQRPVGWDYSGTWVLADDGTVVSSPQADATPPGFYPSARRVGHFELWTGHMWAGNFHTEQQVQQLLMTGA